MASISEFPQDKRDVLPPPLCTPPFDYIGYSTVRNQSITGCISALGIEQINRVEVKRNG